jgi:hypothetical protein
MSVVTGTVAFANLAEHEVYNGQSTGKYSLVLSLDDLKLRSSSRRRQDQVSTRTSTA